MVCIFLVAFSVDVGLARRIAPKIFARAKIFVNVFDSAQYQQVAQRVENLLDDIKGLLAAVFVVARAYGR